MPCKVVAVLPIKFDKESDRYRLKLEGNTEVACTNVEYWMAWRAINSGGFHIVNVNL